MWNEYLVPDFAKGNYSAGAVKYFDALFTKVAGIYGANIALDIPQRRRITAPAAAPRTRAIRPIVRAEARRAAMTEALRLQQTR
jgi:uncharacterized membrane protein YgcG